MTNDFQRKTFDNLGMGSYLCIDPNDPEFFILNTVNEMASGEKVAYFKVIFAECTEKTRLPGDPQCSSQSVIDDYMSDKFVYTV
jgi:hypothetical protein